MKFNLPEPDVRARASGVTLLVLDADGVLTDGQLYFSEHGESMKAFNTLDGQGIKLLQQNGIDVAIISGRKSAALAIRARALGITLLAQGREDKRTALIELCGGCEPDYSAIAYIGDDLPDLQIMQRSALAIAVPDAHESVHRIAHVMTTRRGGNGAVREAADFILQAQDKYEAAIAAFL